MKQIEHLFATEVWLWKYLSIRLPPTAFADEKASEDLRSRYVVNTNFDELDEVARDANGKQKVTKDKSVKINSHFEARQCIKIFELVLNFN